jgi:hypothetical protein
VFALAGIASAATVAVATQATSATRAAPLRKFPRIRFTTSLRPTAAPTTGGDMFSLTCGGTLGIGLVSYQNGQLSVTSGGEPLTTERGRTNAESAEAVVTHASSSVAIGAVSRFTRAETTQVVQGSRAPSRGSSDPERAGALPLRPVASDRGRTSRALVGKSGPRRRRRTVRACRAPRPANRPGHARGAPRPRAR